MGMETCAAWTAKLLITATLLGGYATHPAAPKVTPLPAANLAAEFCFSACRARGAYLPDRGILLDNALDLDGNPADRAILLHELIHYLQDITGRFAAESACDRWRDREIEAYHVQDRYLGRYNMGAGNVSAALEVGPPNCRTGSPDAPPQAQLSGIANTMQLTIVSAERVFELLDEPEETPDAENAIVIARQQ